jgi:hypothetical protein
VVSLVGFPDKAPALIEESLLLTYLRDKVGKAVWSSPDAFLWISQGTLIAFNQKNIHEEITKILAQLQAHSGNLSDLIPPSLIVIHEKMNQNRLTLNFEETPLREVFTFLEDLSSIPFYLDTSLTSSDLLISLSLQEVTFLDVLVMISHLKDFYFYYEDERVVVKAITPRLKKSLEEIPDTFQGKQFSEESSEEPAPRPSNPLARLAQTQVTLDFSDTPLSDIFEFLGQTSGVPIRFDEKLTSLLESSFSFQLSNVPVDSVFDLLSFYFSLDWAIVDQKVLFKPAVFEEEVVEKKLTLPSDLKGLSNQGLKAVLRGASGQKKWFSPKTFLKVSEGEVLAQNTAKVIQELEAFLAQSPEKRKGLSPEIHALENRLLRTMVTLDFEKTPLEQIFYFLADVSGVSFCKHPQCLVENPDNEITIQLEKVSLEKVLQEICALKNLEYRYMEGGIVSISPQ